jgi:HEAT repeat protein
MDGSDRYVAEAVEQGRCTESGDFRKGNAAYDAMIAALAELPRRADRGEAPLLELLDHPNEWVKLSAATHLLPLRSEVASELLDKLASSLRAALRFEAEMVLREWRAGRLKVP